jgi:hypothetical protein
MQKVNRLANRGRRELLYVSADHHVMAVPTMLGSTFTAGKAVPLFDMSPYLSQQIGRMYDVTHDGGRFLLLKTAAHGPGQLRVVENWVEEIAARASGG